MIEVILDWNEMYRASQYGCRRAVESMKLGHGNRNGAKKENLWDLNIRGALGEFAFSKALGIPYEFRLNVFKGPDFGKTGQVKTLMEHWYDLTIRSDARDEDHYVLVTGIGPTFQVHGWYLAGEAKKHAEWIKDPEHRGPAFFVPQKSLLRLDRAEVETW